MNGTLQVAGARLHYQVTGSGPSLLLITGAIMDSSSYTALAAPLAERYTVIAYDQRGNSLSPLDGPAEDQTIPLRADDAHHLLEAVSDEPAYVLGCSSGAVIGLDLALRYPEQVRGLVAFEPPIPTLLSDRDRWATLYGAIVDTLHRDGMGPAMQMWIAGIGMDVAETPAPPPDPTPATERMNANLAFFMEHELLPFSRYELDLAGLRAARTPFAIGVGEASTSRQLPLTTSLSLAERLGTTTVEFPGDHGGATMHPARFAARLDECLRQLAPV